METISKKIQQLIDLTASLQTAQDFCKNMQKTALEALESDQNYMLAFGQVNEFSSECELLKEEIAGLVKANGKVGKTSGVGGSVTTSRKQKVVVTNPDKFLEEVTKKGLSVQDVINKPTLSVTKVGKLISEGHNFENAQKEEYVSVALSLDKIVDATVSGFGDDQIG